MAILFFHFTAISLSLKFVADIELIYSNCIEYNGEDSEYSELSREMRTVFAGLQRVHFDGEPEVEDDDERSRKKKKHDMSHSPSPDITSESSVEEESEDRYALTG